MSGYKGQGLDEALLCSLREVAVRIVNGLRRYSATALLEVQYHFFFGKQGKYVCGDELWCSMKSVGQPF